MYQSQLLEVMSYDLKILFTSQSYGKIYASVIWNKQVILKLYKRNKHH